MSVCGVLEGFGRVFLFLIILLVLATVDCNNVGKAWPVFPKGKHRDKSDQSLISGAIKASPEFTKTAAPCFLLALRIPVLSSFKERKVSGTPVSKGVKYYGLP